MRVVDCDCGAIIQAANDEELVRNVQRHTEEQHPDQPLDEEAARRLVTEQAYSAMDA